MRSLARLIPIALVATLVTSAYAQGPRKPPPLQWQQEFKSAVGQYNLGNVKQAETAFLKLRSQQPKIAGSYRYLAAIYFETKRYEDCLDQAFKSVKLNVKSRYAAQAISLHENCRKKLGLPRWEKKYSPGYGGLAIRANETHIEIKVNNILQGATPIKPREYRAGNVTVTASLIGYHDGVYQVELLPGMVSDLRIELEKKESKKNGTTGMVDPTTGQPIDTRDPTVAGTSGRPAGALDAIKTGWVTIRTNPAEAVVTLDGKAVTMDDKGRIEAVPGVHELVVEAPGHVRKRRRVRVARAQTRSIAIDLQNQAQKSSQRKWGYISLMAAGAMAASGAGFGLLSLSALDEAEDIQRLEESRPGTSTGDFIAIKSREDFQDAKDRGKTYQVLSGVSFGLAAAALGASIYFFISERDEEIPGMAPPFAVAPTADGEGFAVSTGLSF